MSLCTWQFLFCTLSASAFNEPSLHQLDFFLEIFLWKLVHVKWSNGCNLDFNYVCSHFLIIGYSAQRSGYSQWTLYTGNTGQRSLYYTTTQHQVSFFYMCMCIHTCTHTYCVAQFNSFFFSDHFWLIFLLQVKGQWSIDLRTYHDQTWLSYTSW